MVNKNVFRMILCLILVIVFSGCIVRTYTQVKERVDQDLTSGNRGFLMGNSPPPEARKSPATREIMVVEVELKSPVKLEIGRPPAKTKDQSAAGNQGYLVGTQEESIKESVVVEQAIPETTYIKYTVKKDDTLQKISKQFYGTYKKWTKIYESNKDKIKDPNKIRPGIVLEIPQE